MFDEWAEIDLKSFENSSITKYSKRYVKINLTIGKSKNIAKIVQQKSYSKVDTFTNMSAEI